MCGDWAGNSGGTRQGGVEGETGRRLIVGLEVGLGGSGFVRNLGGTLGGGSGMATGGYTGAGTAWATGRGVNGVPEGVVLVSLAGRAGGGPRGTWPDDRWCLS